jgi:nicotinate-nucleotide adenylyltransferase
MLVPSHTPPHKPTVRGTADPLQRLTMCALAAKGESGLSVCDLEVTRGGPSYTVDTLSEVHDADPDAKLTLIMGADVALTLPSWRHPGALMQLAEVAIAERDGAQADGRLAALLEEVEAKGGRARALRMPQVDVSSSLVRERVAAGESIDELVPASVAQYIATHDLYAKDPS